MNDPTVFGRDCFKLNCATTLFNQRDSALYIVHNPQKLSHVQRETALRR